MTKPKGRGGDGTTVAETRAVVSVVTPSEDPAAAQLRAAEVQYAPVIARANAVQVRTTLEAGAAADLYREVKDQFDRVDGVRRALVQPLNDHVKRINGMFRGPLDVLLTASRTVDHKILSFRHAQEEAAERERAKAEAEAAKANAKANAKAEKHGVAPPPPVVAREIAAPPTHFAGDTAGARTRKVWAFEVQDTVKVPEAFKSVNVAMVRAFMGDQVRAGRTPELLGIRFYQEDQLSR